MLVRTLILCALLGLTIGIPATRNVRKRVKSWSELNDCGSLLSKDLVDEIASYDSVTKDIIDYVLNGPFKGRTYDELSLFVDKFGARPSGTQVLEDAIDYMISKTKDEGVADFTTENVEVPHWTRGEESVELIEPRKQSMTVLGLGKIVSTPADGIEAEAIIVGNFTQLDDLDDDLVRGKIVVYDEPYESYGETVKYRSTGAVAAAKKGAVAALVRSIAPFSIDSPHTGSQYYEEGVTEIPIAALTLEDADLLARLASRGEKIVLRIKLTSTLDTKISRNTIVDVKGTENPEKLVIISGHIDSWDVGQGAMDDGGGLFVSWAAPIILNNLNLKPKRTLRSIFWTAEELGLVGAYAYEKAHRNDSHNINFVLESDEGTFTPTGLAVAGTKHAKCIVAEVLKLFSSINASTLVEAASPGSDIAVFLSQGIPGAGLDNANERYFWFHHTEGDTMNVEDPHELDLGTAFWTAVSYVIADISSDIPRENK